MSLGIPKSSFNFIELNFADIIEEIREGANGLLSDWRIVRKTIVFRDMSKMYCVEHLEEDGKHIELYWYEADKSLIMKFHAHYHEDGTPEKITKFDPYHIHYGADGQDRHVNDKFRELVLILEFIRVRKMSLKQQ